MSDLSEKSIGCPYCGERLSILVDPYDSGEEYIEDCQVCCRPIVIFVDPVSSDVAVRGEDDTTF